REASELTAPSATGNLLRAPPTRPLQPTIDLLSDDPSPPPSNGTVEARSSPHRHSKRDADAANRKPCFFEELRRRFPWPGQNRLPRGLEKPASFVIARRYCGTHGREPALKTGNRRLRCDRSHASRPRIACARPRTNCIAAVAPLLHSGVCHALA